MGEHRRGKPELGTHVLDDGFGNATGLRKQDALDDWLVEELNEQYGISHEQGRFWVKSNRVIPLLDGLDEIDPKDRHEGIEAINTFSYGCCLTRFHELQNVGAISGGAHAAIGAGTEPLPGRDVR